MVSNFYRCDESGLGVQVFRYERAISFPVHRHNEMAIVICTKGALESNQLEHKEILHEGQVLFTHSEVPHSSRYCVDGKPTSGVTVELDSDVLKRLGYSGSSIYMSARFLGMMNLQEVSHLARIIQDESFKNEADSPLLIAALARQIVILTLRQWPKVLIHCQKMLKSAQLPRNELVRSIEFMSLTPAREFAVEDLARRMHRSTSAFSRLFSRSVGESPYSFYLRSLLQRAAIQLATTQEQIKVIALESGFDSVSHFSNSFRKKWNMTPTEYRLKASQIPYSELVLNQGSLHESLLA